MNDILDDPDFQEFAQLVRELVAPNIKASAYVITIAPEGGNADIKQAVEIGLAILMNKPLIVLKMPGRVVAEKLLRIADHIVEGDMNTEDGRDSVMAQLKQAMRQ